MPCYNVYRRSLFSCHPCVTAAKILVYCWSILSAQNVRVLKTTIPWLAPCKTPSCVKVWPCFLKWLVCNNGPVIFGNYNIGLAVHYSTIAIPTVGKYRTLRLIYVIQKIQAMSQGIRLKIVVKTINANPAILVMMNYKPL